MRLPIIVSIPIPIPKYVVQSVPDSGSAGWVGTGVGACAISVDVGAGVGVGVTVVQTQLVEPVQAAFLQLPDADPEGMKHTILDVHCESVVQTELHCGTGDGDGEGVGDGVAVTKGVGEAVGLGEGEGDLVGDGDGLGDGVTQTQSVSVKHCVFLQNPAEQVKPLGHCELAVQTLLH